MFARDRREPSTVGTLVFLLWGLIVWGLQFTAVYVGHTWLCALEASMVSPGMASAVLTVLAVALVVPVAVAPGRAATAVALRPVEADARHLILIARVIAILSIVAALWTGGTAAFVQSCALGR